MAVHQRHLIREAVVELLKAGVPDVVGRVYDTPTDPRSTFPALVVEDVGESQAVSVVFGMPQRPVERTLSLIVTAELHQVGSYARARDQLMAQVETLLANNGIAGLKDCVPAGYQPDTTGDGAQPIAIGRQRFDITYITPQGSPAVLM